MNDNRPQQRRRYAPSQPETAYQQPFPFAREQANPAKPGERYQAAHTQQNDMSRQPSADRQSPVYFPYPSSQTAPVFHTDPVRQPVQQQPVWQYGAEYEAKTDRTIHADASYCPASGHYAPPNSEQGKRGKRTAAKRRPKRPKGEKNTQPLVQRLLLILCVVVFAVSAFLLIRYFVNILITRRASAQLEAVYSASVEATEEPTGTPVPTYTPVPMPAAPQQEKAVAAPPPPTDPPKELWPRQYPKNPTLRVSSVFYELQRQNPDIIGWLKIDGLLEEAVVQRDNEYYLTHNALRQKSVTGALFLEETCDLKTVPTQMLIHGHNMKEGAMFGSLKKYKVKDASFYRAHPYIEFNTIYENSRYVIFAVAEVDLRWNKGDYLPFWQDVRFASAEDFMAYVKKARDLSHYRCNVDVVPGDRLLTLSTCTGTDDNKRLIVMARRIRDGEDLTQLNMAVLSTGDR